jgi:hypothetical protein
MVWTTCVALGALVLAAAATGAGVKARPDLRVTALSAAGPAAPGATLDLTGTVRNAGKGKAKASTTRFYVSRDRAVSADDLRLTGTQAVKALKKGAKGPLRARVILPATTPSGLVSLLACADDLKKVRESNERNNCRAVAIQVQAPPLAPAPPALVDAPASTPTPTPTASATATATATPPPDTNAPAAPALTATDPASPANDATPALSGTAEAGSTLRVFRSTNCSGPELATTTVPTGGGFTLTVTVPEGASSFTATAIDAAQNTSACSSALGYTHDATPPAAPVLTAFDPAAGTNTNPTVSGTAEAGSVIRIFRNGVCDGTPAMTTTTAGNGAFTMPVAVEENKATTFSVLARDLAGNLSPCSNQRTYTHDSIAPEAPSLTGTSPGSPSSDATPDVLGANPDSGTTVRVYLTAACTGAVAATKTGAGPFTLNVAVPANVVTQISARAIDAAGNQSPCSNALAYEHDDIAPDTPQFTSTTPASPSNASTSPTFHGSNGKGTMAIRIFRNEACDASPLTTVAPGDETFEVDVNAAPNATTEIRAQALDAAGNLSACSDVFAYVHDTIAPALPTVTGTQPGSPGNDASPDVVGTAEPGAQVTVHPTEDCSGAAAGSGTVSPGGGFAVAATAQQNAQTAFSVRVSDAAGNASGCAGPVMYLHDGIAPTLDFPTLLPAAEANDETPTLKGTSGSDATLEFFATACTGTPVATGTPAAFANPGVDVPVANGFKGTLAVQAVDAAGNRSSCGTRAYTEILDLAEVEPNNSDVDADARADSDGVRLDGTNGIRSVNQAQFIFDQDVFRFDLDEPMRIDARLGPINGIGCPAFQSQSFSMDLRTNGALSTPYRFAECSYTNRLIGPVAPGTQHLRVTNVQSPYLVRVKWTPFATTESEPNDSEAAAKLAPVSVPQPGGLIRGSLASDDTDVVRVVLSADSALDAVLTKRDGTGCFTTDVQMRLTTEGGETVAEGQPVDGCGQMSAPELPAGEYYVTIAGGTGKFGTDYLLEVKPRPIDSRAEVEPNNTATQAAAVLEGGLGIDGQAQIAGTQHFESDTDVFAVPDDGGVHHVETTAGVGRTACRFDREASLSLRDATQEEVQYSRSTLSMCTGLTFSSPAGGGTLRVGFPTRGDQLVNPYLLRMTSLPSLGAGGVGPFGMTALGYRSATLPDTTTTHTYTVEVQQGQDIHAAVLRVPGETINACSSTGAGLNMNLQLKKSDGTLLTGPGGFTSPCRMISGFEGGNKVAAAADLPAGLYRLEVTGATSGTGGSAATPYRIAVLVR